jgi:GNAT superfamily N-acetyltransferase
VPWPPPPNVAITMATEAQVGNLVQLRRREANDDRERLYRERLRRGQKCFVATIAGEVVGGNWTCFGNEPDGSITYALAPDEILTTDAYTAVAHRGRSIHTALLHAMLAWAQQAGYRRAYTYRTLGNRNPAKGLRLLNWRRSSSLRYVVLSSPLLCRATGRCYEIVLELRRGPPVAPGPVLRRVPA